MENNVGVGIIVGLTVASSLYVWNSESFSKEQKTILLLLLIFPPAQWLGILIVCVFNGQSKNNINSSISKLTNLKDKGIITPEEYKTKVEKLETKKTELNLKNSSEHRQLKSLLDSGVLTKEEFENNIKLINTVKPKVAPTEIRGTQNKESFFPYIIIAVILMMIIMFISMEK